MIWFRTLPKAGAYEKLMQFSPWATGSLEYVGVNSHPASQEFPLYDATVDVDIESLHRCPVLRAFVDKLNIPPEVGKVMRETKDKKARNRSSEEA